MDANSAKMIGAGIAMIASLGSGIGLGVLFASWISLSSLSSSELWILFPE